MSCIPMRGRLVALSLLAVAAQAADEPSPIIVEAQSGPDPIPWRLGAPASDLADWLRGEPGVQTVRMGGHGLDPVVDGQGGPRLRVTIDGCPVQGGCPNRMDPPTSYASVGAFDEVILQHGRNDVREAGGSAGNISIARDVPRFTGPGLLGRVGVSAAGQGHERQAWADVSAGDERGGIRAIAGLGAAGNYSNGSGVDVPSSWRQQHGTVLAAWRPLDGQTFSLGGTMVRGRDMRYAGASMDAPVSDLSLLRAGTRQILGDWRIDATAFRSQVDHEMDNYSLRTWTAPMAMRAVSSADVTGGRVDAQRREGAVRPACGVDVEVQQLAARRTRAMSPTAAPVLESVLWPEVQLARIGGYAELTGDLGAWRATLGARLDLLDSSAAARDEDPVGMQLSARALYQDSYGSDGGDRREWLPAAVLHLEHPIVADGRLGLSLGRTMRAADATERFMAMNGNPPSARWVGNPDIAAEAHHQVRLQAAWNDDGWLTASLSGFADRVQDHILRDRARGQEGVLTSNGSTIYHNTEALYLGSGAMLDWRCHALLSVAATVDQVWAKDLRSGLPLAQIPPVSGVASVRGHLCDGRLVAMASMRWAAHQSRVDDDTATGSGLDQSEGSGWAVVDLRLTWTQAGLGELAIGCDNLFDRTYAEHLAKPAAFDPTVTQVDEPGRSVWVSGEWRF
jgi:iron complex outermembrane recepter protein